MSQRPGEVSALLSQIQSGDRSAESKLLELLYADLRRVAGHIMRGERPDHTLQPTALVHEAYVRIIGDAPVLARDRTHFLAIAARAMRRLLVDHARARDSAKRGGPVRPIPLEDCFIFDQRRSADFLAVHQALERLRDWAPRQSNIVEMRFFGGMSEEEIADYLQVSSRTVKREWAMARAWLHAELSG